MKNIFNKIAKNWYKIYLLTSVFFVIFMYGFVVGNYHIAPYHTLHNAKLAFEDLFTNKNYKQYAMIRPEKFIHPAKYSGSGVTINDSTKTFNGYTLITSMWNDTSGLKLFDMDGTELHSWLVSYNSIFPIPDSTEDKISDWDVDVHGSVIYPNGDIVFNLNGRGLVKIDKDTNIIWKQKGDYHHSVFRDEFGNIWVPGRESHKDTIKTYLQLHPPYNEDFICEFSPDGKLLKKFSLLEVFYNSGLEALLLANGKYAASKKANDITHLNDIDVLSSDMVKFFPQFKAGDLMISMRHLNLIIIVDPLTKTIKWNMIGPYIRQHDPDFTDNGKIAVFDNRTDDASGLILGGSRIVEIDPITREFTIAYEGNEKEPFYTTLAGKQQILPNGNYLITEYEGGRVFEVTEEGEIVWTFITRYDEDEVYSVSDAMRISKNYLNFIE